MGEISEWAANESRSPEGPQPMNVVIEKLEDAMERKLRALQEEVAALRDQLDGLGR